MSEDVKARDQHAISKKGLSEGSIGLLGAVVIGVSCVAPAYTLTAALGPTVSEVGFQVPAIILVGFIPMLLVALGYRELNHAMPDSGTSFTWATRAFGPYLGWMGGWGLISATILVLSNLAGIAVEFLYLLISQVTGQDGIAALADNVWINVVTCLTFMAAATAISYRDMQTTQRLQYVLVSFQVAVLILFGAMAIYRFTQGEAYDASAFSWEWLNPTAVESFSLFAAGVSLSIFIFWGWDVTLTMNEETKDPDKTPGRAAALTVITIVTLYLFLSISLLMYAGTGTGEYGLGNKHIQENVFHALSGPVLGPLAALVSLAVLSSSAASLQATFVSPARTLLAMGHYRALPKAFARIHPRFLTPGFSVLVSSVIASVFYTVMRFISENVLWDTITALGMMICFYYGLTAYASVWYFRTQLTKSARNFVFMGLAPFIGGTVLLVLFVHTLIDSMDPKYGSGSSIGGVGLVFVLGMTVMIVGILLMLWQRITMPGFFKGETLTRGVSDGHEDDAVTLPE